MSERQVEVNELPRSVKIGPIEYEVEAVPDLTHELDGKTVYLNGHILLDEEKIVIDAGLSYRQAVVTLWHEIFHAILGQAGSEAAFDESIVRPLGYGLLDVAINNPRLLETLRERKQGDTGTRTAEDVQATYEGLVAAFDAIFGKVEGPEYVFESTPGSEVPMADLTGVQEVEIEPVNICDVEWSVPLSEQLLEAASSVEGGDLVQVSKLNLRVWAAQAEALETYKNPSRDEPTESDVPDFEFKFEFEDEYVSMDEPTGSDVMLSREGAEDMPEDWRLPMDAWTTDTVCGARGDDPDPGTELDAEDYIGGCHCWACRGQS